MKEKREVITLSPHEVFGSMLLFAFLFVGFLWTLPFSIPRELREDMARHEAHEKRVEYWLTHPEPEEVCAPTTAPHNVMVEVDQKTKDGKVVKMMVTAYCPCKKCCGKWAKKKKTALGDNARVTDGVAVDFGLIPKRSKLIIPGVGKKEADDTGGAMRESARKGITHIDVRMKTHTEARRFGVQQLEVEVIAPDAN